MILFSEGSKLVYHRLPWKEPEAPYLLEVLYEDEDMVKECYLLALPLLCY